jgi:hypothetical protein
MSCLGLSWLRLRDHINQAINDFFYNKHYPSKTLGGGGLGARFDVVAGWKGREKKKSSPLPSGVSAMRSTQQLSAGQTRRTASENSPTGKSIRQLKGARRLIVRVKNPD